MSCRTPLEAFFTLLRVAIGRGELSALSIDPAWWSTIYEIAKRQGLIGVLFLAVSKLPINQRPERKDWLQWVMSADQIKQISSRADDAASRVVKTLRQDGFRVVLLKGQGIARLYPHIESRLAGDVDVWVDADRQTIIDYVRQNKPHCRPVYHHIDALVGGVENVEIHFTPSWMYCFSTNRKLQNFFLEQSKTLFESIEYVDIEGVSVLIPTRTFNSIYILVHLYRHLFDEGIGLRQLLDYYYVLNQPAEIDIILYRNKLQELRLENFASAVSYIMVDWFGVQLDELIVPPNELLGKQLESEVLRAGNLGKYGFGRRLLRTTSRWEKSWLKLKRNLQFLFYYSSEVITSPLFKIWHYLWRRSHGWTT